jgi:uncharacterized membrane protein YkgB
MQLQTLDLKVISWFRKAFVPMARIAVFIVYFYFGILKLLDLSPASLLATALTEKTIGLAHYHAAFTALAIFECIIGLLFLIPRATRVVIPLLLIHMAIVCAPLVLIPGQVWTQAFVPNLEGQYIIKNVVIIAVAIGIASQTPPLAKHTHQ